MSRPARHAASSPTPPPSIPRRAVDVARRAHEREGTRGSDFWNPAGSHKAQEESLLRPKDPFPDRHSTESAPPAFENRTPSSHPRVAFSEADEPQADSDHKTRKGGVGSAEHSHQTLKDYAINKLRASDPRTSHTPPTGVGHLDPPPSTQRWQYHLGPSPPTRSQHLLDPSTSQAKPPATPRRRGHTPSRNRRQPQHKPKPRPEPFIPLDPYRLTISPIAPARSFFRYMGDLAMQGLPNREGQAPGGAENDLELGIRPKPTEASVRAETEQLQGQLRGRLIHVRRGSPSDGAKHFPAASTSLPNLPESQLAQRHNTLYPPGQLSYNPEEGPPSRRGTPEKTSRSRPSSKVSGEGDSERKERNGDNKPVPHHSPPEAFTSPKPASEPAIHHTPLLSRISPLHLSSRLPGISHSNDHKQKYPQPGYWEEVTRQIYRHLLLRLPSLYFNRVSRVFQEARMSKPDLELLISRTTATQAVLVGGTIALGVGGGNISAAQGGEESKRWVTDVLDSVTGTPRRSLGTPRHPSGREGLPDENAVVNTWGSPEFGPSPSPKIIPLGLHGQEASQATLADTVPPGEQWTVPHVPLSLERFKGEWEEFVIGLIKEWKTLNILSALLLTAVFTVFQIEEAAQNVLTRTLGMLSLISALMSLIFGCLYILRFSTMRTMRKAAKWAEEAQKTTSDILWNVWVFLALPACWLAWSVIYFCLTVVCIIWTTGNGRTPLLDSALSNASGDLDPFSGAILAPRVVETFFFVVGIFYFVMVVRTFWVWGSVGVIPLRAGEGEHADDHHSKEDNVATFAPAPPARIVPSGTGKVLGVVLETKEGGSSVPRSSDQYTDTDEKQRGRSPWKRDAARVEVVAATGETGSEKGRGRWWERVTSKENLNESVAKTVDVDALDLPVEAEVELESQWEAERSRERDVSVRGAGESSTPGSILGVSLHG